MCASAAPPDSPMPIGAQRVHAVPPFVVQPSDGGALWRAWCRCAGNQRRQLASAPRALLNARALGTARGRRFQHHDARAGGSARTPEARAGIEGLAIGA